MKAYGKYILIEPFLREEKTKSGIILTGSMEEGKYYSGKGKVLSVGQDVPHISPGDIVRFKAHHESVLEPSVDKSVEKWSIPVESVLAVEAKQK